MMLRLTLLAVMLALPVAGQEEKPNHKAACPTGCKPCTTAVTKALDHLAGEQEDNGRIPGADWKLRYVRSDAHISHVFTTSIAGLAFLAEGSTSSKGKYKKAVAGVRDYLNVRLDEITAVARRRAGGGGGPIYSAVLSLFFFTHLYDAEEKKEDGQMVVKLIKYLTDCVGSKIDKSAWQKAPDRGTVWYVSGVTALANATTIALARARASGFEVPDRVFTLMKSYYSKIVEKNGSFKYDIDNMFPHEPRAGRSITSILTLKAMGVKLEKEYEPLLGYARKNLAKTMTHHTPTLHMSWCAFVFHQLGGEDRRKYVETYHQVLIERQKEDGSLATLWDMDKKLMMRPNDRQFGPNYATANFALLMQVSKKNVRLWKPKEY